MTNALLDELREIAKEEGISLGEVIRQGLEWRAKTRRRVPSFVGDVASGYSDTSSRVDELIAGAVRAKHDRIRAEWLDRRHFSVVRPLHVDSFTLVP